MKQAHPQIFGGVDDRAIDCDGTVSNTHDEFALYHTLNLNVVLHPLRCGEYLPGKLHITGAQCAPSARIAAPA